MSETHTTDIVQVCAIKVHIGIKQIKHMICCSVLMQIYCVYVSMIPRFSKGPSI